MSKQRDRIRKAVESRGYAVESLEWEPWTPGGEKEGIGGGWSLIVDRDFLPNTTPGNDMGALSADELLAEIDVWLEPSEPCDCPDQLRSSGTRRHPSRSLKGEPERPLHEPDCRWRIDYHLRWWSPEGGWPA